MKSTALRSRMTRSSSPRACVELAARHHVELPAHRDDYEAAAAFRREPEFIHLYSPVSAQHG